jgi:hypothetical protein
LKYCPDTGDKIFVRSVTLTDIKYAKRTGEQPNKNQKQLLWIPSKQMRQECYDNAARALEAKENQILPTYGSRPWQVTVKMGEPNNTHKRSPLFRWFRGELELAALPHLLEKVPNPKESRGLAKLEEEEEEGFFHSTTELCERAPSQLSRVAWNDPDHGIPSVTLKWLSPNHQTFHSRKSAEEHATVLVAQQLMVDKVVFGYGSRGQPLRPTKPTKKDALTAGKWRFLRDGLWVVGQEESWQAQRAKDVVKETALKEAATKEAAAAKAAAALLEQEQRKEEGGVVSATTATKAAAPKKKKPPKPPRQLAPIKRPIQLFLRTQRELFRNDMLQKMAAIEDDVTQSSFKLPEADLHLKEIWRKMHKEEKQIWKDLVDGVPTKVPGESNQEDSNDATVEEKQEYAKKCKPTDDDANDAEAINKKGLRVYIRDHRDHLRRQRVGQMAHLQQEGDTTPATDRYTLEQADEDLCKMWGGLDDATRKDWEDKAANEATSVVISPGESEEEVDEAAQEANASETLEDEPIDVKGEDDSPEDKNEAPTESEADQNGRRSKRTRKKRSLDIPDDPTPAKKSKPRRTSPWAFPIVESSTPAANETVKDVTPEDNVSMPTTDGKVEEATPEVSASVPEEAKLEASVSLPEQATLDAIISIAATEGKVDEKKPEVNLDVSASAVLSGDKMSSVDTSVTSTDEKVVMKIPDLGTSMSPSTEKGEEKNAAVDKPVEEKKPVPKRKRSACPPKQISQSAHWRLSAEQIRLCHEAATDHFEKVMYTVQARALFAELADGFDLLRERGRGRYDMELPTFDQEEFSFLTDLQKAPWMPVVKQMLGEEVVLIHKGVFLSNPGAEAQVYHQDGPHLSKQHQRPCHAVNVFVPLIDLTLRNGPTEFVSGSHILGYDTFDRSKVVTPEVPAGTPIIFDYRLGHRGLANTSNVCRPIVYCTYAAVADGKAFKDSVNFSRKRYHRLGDFVEKPLSREERRKLRDLAREDRECSDAVEQIEAAAVETKESNPVPNGQSEAHNSQLTTPQAVSEN